LPAILALAGFLVSGSLGVSARATLCTHANGVVHVDMPFNGCCDSEGRQDEDQDEVFNQTVVLTAAGVPASDCGSCDDVPVEGDAARVSPSRTTHAGSEVLHLEALTPVVSSLSGVDRYDTNPFTSRPPSPAGAALASIQTIVLRC